MTNRPTAVTVIGWFWKAGGVIGMVSSLPIALWGRGWFQAYWSDFLLGLSPSLLFFVFFLSSLLCFISGNGLLNGQNWARALILVYCVVAAFLSLIWYQDHPNRWISFIGNLIFTVIMWLFLYLPPVAAFFRPEEQSPE